MADAHTPYLEMNVLKRKYFKYKKSGRGGIREDVYEDMMLKYKYAFIDKRIEYLTIRKRSDLQERLYSFGKWGDKNVEKLIENKMNNDIELIQLKRLVKILRIQLTKKGYKPIYL